MTASSAICGLLRSIVWKSRNLIVGGGSRHGGLHSSPASLDAASGPKTATPASDIDASLVSYGIEAKSARLFLQGRGFGRKRRVVGLVNTWLYVYKFADSDGQKGVESHVKLR